MCRKVIVSLIVVVAAVLVGLQFKTRVDIPPHLLGHSHLFVPDMLKPETSARLLSMMKEMKELPSNQQDTKFYKVQHEHVGEWIPIGPNGTCSHPFLVPDIAKKGCILPGRVDVGRHFVMAGGVEGMKESYEDMISRVQSFGRYIFDLDEHPFVKGLFADKSFVDAAKYICPKDKQVLDPFQFNFIVQVPGQSVALHLDAPYMWGATRFQFPQWLLVAMVYSGLFQDIFVDQVQVVGYFHPWNDTNNEREGQFVFWDRNIPKYLSVPPRGNAGSAVDGSKVVHAASIYYPNRKAPRMDKNKNNRLVFQGNEDWFLYSDDQVIEKFKTDDLRMTIVYRARCFESEERKKKFNNLPESEWLKLEQVFNSFQRDMIKKGVLRANEPRGSVLEFALKIMDTYIKYPFPGNAIIPYNYCALSRLYPQADAILKYIC